MYVSFMVIAQACVTAAAGDESPIRVELLGEFASFINREHPGNRIGYRFHEHTPLTYGEPPKPGDDAQQLALAQEQEDRFRNRPGVQTFREHVTEESWAPETWTFYLAPVQDGIDLLLIVETEDVGLPEFYGIQQCFRLSGATNAERRKYAYTPSWEGARPRAPEPERGRN